jgi:hypothetical protein
MKKYITISILFILIFLNVNAQLKQDTKYFDDLMHCTINFEANWCPIYYMIDTSQIGSIWHICTPHKLLFDSSYSKPKAILTDSIGPYPINDTSSFTIKTVIGGFDMPCIGGQYKMDSDSLHDFGYIEISIDHGQTWHNVMSDTVLSNVYWNGNKPIFTGRINEWTAFLTGPLSQFAANDTLLTRFTFISDSVQTNKEGWILDDIKVVVHAEGVPELKNQDNIVISPNPATSIVNIECPGKQDLKLTLFNLIGDQVMQKDFKGSKETIDISALPSGMYIVKVSGRDFTSQNKLIKK